jgi:ankyrin repeat protein
LPEAAVNIQVYLVIWARVALAWVLVAPTFAAPVDYARDIQPLLEEHCYECHGPKQQKNGYRLDRRSVAFAGLLRHNIIPGSSESSRVYRRVVDSQFGLQMPPKEPLSPQAIDTVRRWIDEGASWPNELANELDLPPPDEAAVKMNELIRASQFQPARHADVLAQIQAKPSIVNARGSGGATPLMSAALYGDIELLTAMLEAGGNPNLRNDAGASALLWAVDDLRKVRLLLDHGADVNAASNFGRTTLSLAAGGPNSAPLVALLLERGAKPSAAALSAAARLSPTSVRLLLAAGASDKGEAAEVALRSGCKECLAALLPDANTPLPRGLLNVLPVGGAGDPEAVNAALARGADVNVSDAKSRSALMLAAISESVTSELVQQMIDRGADVSAKSVEGLNALDYALRLGRQPIIDVLTRAGVTPTRATEPMPAFLTNNSARAAVERSLPLLQRSSARFYEKAGCVSCHHSLLTAMTVDKARRQGFVVDEEIARRELLTLARDIDEMRDQALQGPFLAGSFATTTGYVLMDLSATSYPADASTDALVRLLRRTQLADGRWTSPVVRPPIEASEITATALGLRGILLYGNKQSAADAAAIAAAKSWLEAAAPQNSESRAFRLFGLTWAGSSKPARQSAIRALLARQRADGGWAQLEYRNSDAYATGQALVALHEAGVSASSAAYRRGVDYLLRTQLADGSWLVRTRSHFTQSYFESGFPHGVDQFISAAATNWATQALADSSRSSHARRM